MGVVHWSKTPSANQSSDPDVYLVEGQPANTINNAIRAAMAAVAEWRDDNLGILVAAKGVGNSYSVTTNQGIPNLTQAFSVRFTASAACVAGAATLTVDANTAKPLKMEDGSDPGASDINTARIYTAFWIPALDRFVVQGRGLQTGGTIAGALTISSGGLTVATGGLAVSAGGAAITGNSAVTGTLNVTSTLSQNGNAVWHAGNLNPALLAPLANPQFTGAARFGDANFYATISGPNPIFVFNPNCYLYYARESGALVHVVNGIEVHRFSNGGAYSNAQIGDLNSRIESRAAAYADDRLATANNISLARHHASLVDIYFVGVNDFLRGSGGIADSGYGHAMTGLGYPDGVNLYGRGRVLQKVYGNGAVYTVAYL